MSRTSFIALDISDRLDPLASEISPLATPEHEADAKLAAFDRAALHLEPFLAQQLRDNRLDPSRLVMVGFGFGGTLALHMLLRRGWNCAGVLAFAAQLDPPLPCLLRADRRVRLIGGTEGGREAGGGIRAAMDLLMARGVDARGAVLAGSVLAGAALSDPVLSDEAIRHGGAYLVELVAIAQRGDRLHNNQESCNAR